MSHRPLAPSLLLVLALGACRSAAAPQPTQSPEPSPVPVATRAPAPSPGELPAPEPSVVDLELAFERAAEAIAPSVVSVINEQSAPAELPSFLRELAPREGVTGLGSGVIIDEAGYILTNNHVVEGATTLKVRLHDDRELHAELVGTDPKTDLAVIRVRAEGLRRLRRAALELPPFAALVLVHLAWPGLHANPWVEAFWALWLTWLGVSAFVDLVSGVAMQTGIAVAEAFDVPPLARSPRDFWGRRWNLVVHDMVLRHVFLPLGGLRRPLRATFWVFAMSGLIHELFVLMALGHPARHSGFMMLFFGLHGLAVMAQLWWDRGPGRRRSMPRPLAVALHLGWMTLTSPLFFAPIGEVFADAWPN